MKTRGELLTKRLFIEHIYYCTVNNLRAKSYS